MQVAVTAERLLQLPSNSHAAATGNNVGCDIPSLSWKDELFDRFLLGYMMHEYLAGVSGNCSLEKEHPFHTLLPCSNSPLNRNKSITV